MDYRYTIIDADGTETRYDHILAIRNVTDFKYGQNICVVQNEDTLDFWVLAPAYTVLDYLPAYESLARYYYDSYGWDFHNLLHFTFVVGR